MEIDTKRMTLTLTRGEMPTREQFDAQWDANTPRRKDDGQEGFAFGNDKRLGCCVLSRDELWAELQKAIAEYGRFLDGVAGDPDPEITGNWISCVLETLHIEWI